MNKPTFTKSINYQLPATPDASQGGLITDYLPRLTRVKAGRSFNFGFTLIEIMLVVTIMTVVSLFAFINTAAAREKQTVRQAAITTLNILDQARLLSIQSQDKHYYEVKVNTASTPNTITLSCYNTTIAPCRPDQITRLPSGITINFTSAKVFFQPGSGRAAKNDSNPNQYYTSPETLTIQSTNWKIDIKIPPNGAIYMEEIQKI